MQDPRLIPGSGRSPGEGTGSPCSHSWASRAAQLVKNPPAMWETWVGKIPWKRPTPVFLPGEIPRTEEPGGLQSRSRRVGHECLSTHNTAVSLPTADLNREPRPRKARCSRVLLDCAPGLEEVVKAHLYILELYLHWTWISQGFGAKMMPWRSYFPKLPHVPHSLEGSMLPTKSLKAGLQPWTQALIYHFLLTASSVYSPPNQSDWNLFQFLSSSAF